MKKNRKNVSGKNQARSGVVFRSEWKVTSGFRPPRTETYDISFAFGQSVHQNLSEKLMYAERKLKEHTLRFGEELVLSKVYFIGKG
jgi:hypothetical protein